MDYVARPAPTLETGRLRLRAFRAEDFAAHQAIMTKVFTQGFLGTPMSKEELWRRVVSSVGMWQVVGFGGLMIERKNDGQIIGNTGLFVAPRELEPSFGGEPEMGWILDPAVHGHGYAMEAGRAVIDWADVTLASAIWAIISPGNDASFRIAEKLGFEHFRESRYHDEPISVLRRPAP